MPSQSRTTSSAATRFEGVGLAGQQQQQRDRERAREKTQQAIAPSRAPPRQTSDSFRAADVCTPFATMTHADVQPPTVHKPLVAERRAPAPPRPAGPSAPASQPAPRAPERMPKAVPTPAPVAPPAASTERPERRISAMTEAQIMEKLRTVVSPQDPSLLYSKIKKVGQG
jgi:protein-serine/threonine kinase